MATLEVIGDAYFPTTPTCFLVGESILMDTGASLGALGERLQLVKHIIITHSHMDHILNLPLLVDILCFSMKRRLTVWTNEATAQALQRHIFNDTVWPKLPRRLMEIRVITGPVQIEGTEFIPVEANHRVPTTGFVINKGIYITGDTTDTQRIWDTVKKVPIKHLFVDVSWPERLHHLSETTGHFSTKGLQEALKRELSRNLTPPVIYAYHQKPAFFQEIKEELQRIERELGVEIKVVIPGLKVRV